MFYPKNVGFSDGLSVAQPDEAECLIVPEYNHFPSVTSLAELPVFISGPSATTLPHLAGEWTVLGKDLIEARIQAAYDGDCMVYGRKQARSFLGSPDPDGHTFVSNFTTDGASLDKFAHYSSQFEDQVKYINFQPLALWLHPATRIKQGPKTDKE